jgi:hypothetical protein
MFNLDHHVLPCLFIFEQQENTNVHDNAKRESNIKTPMHFLMHVQILWLAYPITWLSMISSFMSIIITIIWSMNYWKYDTQQFSQRIMFQICCNCSNNSMLYDDKFIQNILQITQYALILQLYSKFWTCMHVSKFQIFEEVKKK